MADENERAKVKCSECGLLALKSSAPGEVPNSLATEEFRKMATHPRVGHFTAPFCYAKAIPLDTIWKDECKPWYPSENTFLEVINKPRECSKFHEWDGISSPPKVAEMIEASKIAAIQAESHMKDMDRAERQFKEQLAHQSAEAEKARLWQEQQEAKRIADQKSRDEDQHQKQIDRDKIQANRQFRKSVVLAIVTAVVASIGSIGGFFGGKYFEKHFDVKEPVPQTAPPK